MSGIRVERSGPLLTVILDNPERHNAQTPSMWAALADVKTQIDADVRVIAVWGQGPSFSAGLDRRLLAAEAVDAEMALADIPVSERDAFVRAAQSAFTWWGEVDAITIALVQGNAIGAGFQLALACDLRVVAPDARFAMRETSLGLIPDLGGTRPLVESIGYSRALEICATGRFVDADEAVRIGLATAVVPQDQWSAWMDRSFAPILAADPQAVAELKHLLRGAAGNDRQLDREREAQLRRMAALMRS